MNIYVYVNISIHTFFYVKMYTIQACLSIKLVNNAFQTRYFV